MYAYQTYRVCRINNIRDLANGLHRIFLVQVVFADRLISGRINGAIDTGHFLFTGLQRLCPRFIRRSQVFNLFYRIAFCEIDGNGPIMRTPALDC